MKTLLLIFSFFITVSAQCMELPVIQIQNTQKPAIEYATALWQNNKSFQEDTITCAKLQNGHFFGVYDGHGSNRSDNNVSSFLRDNLHHIFEKSEKELIREKLEDAFAQAEKQVLENYEDGSTAVVAYIDENQILHLAWVGDSRAILAKNKMTGYTTRDHDPLYSPSERERILGHGLIIENGYIVISDNEHTNYLSMSRSIGDKKCKEITPQKPNGNGGIIASPEYHAIQLTPDNHFLIIATDGLWFDVLNYYAIEITAKMKNDPSSLKSMLISAKQTPPNFTDKSSECDESFLSAAKILGADAIGRGSKDNIAIIMVQLKWQEIKKENIHNG